MIAEHVDLGTAVLVVMVVWGAGVLIVQFFTEEWEERK